MEVDTQAKAYFKEIVLRIQIALAIAVIRTTPPGTTAKEHAKSIQAIYKLKSTDTIHSGSLDKHEQEVLHSQQKELLSKLWCVTKKATLHQQGSSSDIFGTSGECFPPTVGGTKCKLEETLVESDTDDTSEQNIEPDLQFIHAIAHLTSVINSFAYVPTDEYQKILSSATDSVFTGSSAKENMCKSQDIISASVGQNGKSCISSEMVKYIMHSSNGRRVLFNSVQCVLQYLNKHINVENEAKVEKLTLSWRGSLLEYSVKVILDLVECAAEEDEENNQYLQVCLDFIQNIVNGILKSNALCKHEMWEQLCGVALEVGKNKHICFRMITFLIEIVKSMNEKLKSTNDFPKEYHRSLDIEKSFYLFYLLKEFIKNWKHFHYSDQSLKNKNETFSKNVNSSANITSLWRKKWMDSGVVNQEKMDSNEEDIIDIWKDVLQDCMMICKEQYPLLMAYLWECILQLESGDK